MKLPSPEELCRRAQKFTDTGATEGWVSSLHWPRGRWGTWDLATIPGVIAQLKVPEGADERELAKQEEVASAMRRINERYELAREMRHCLMEWADAMKDEEGGKQ